MGNIRSTSTNMKTTLVFAATFIALALALPNQHDVEKRPMPKPLQFLAKLPQLLRKNVKGDPIKDCTDAEDVMKCVEEVLLGVSDCVDCICDILSIIGGGDASNCDPAEIKKFIQKSYNNNRK